MKAKWIRKTFMCFLLICTIAGTTAYTVWETPKEVKAIALVDDALIILAILAAVGISHGISMNQNAPDLDAWKQGISGQLNDALKANYDWIVENGGIYEGDYNFDPNNDDPNEKPPKWDQLKEWIKKQGGKIKIAAGGALAGVLGLFGKKLHDESEKGEYLPNNSDFELPSTFADTVKDYPYYFFSGYVQDIGYTGVKYFKFPPAAYQDQYTAGYININTKHQYYLSGYSYVSSAYVDNWTVGAPEKDYVHYGSKPYITNIPIYPTLAEAQAATSNPTGQEKPVYPGLLNPYTLPFGTDAQNYIKNNPDSPTLPVAPQVNAPTQEEVAQYLQDLINSMNNPNNDPEPRQTVVNNFIQNMTKPETDPEPQPTPVPDPNPDPDISPTPDPEKPDPDIENGKYTYDLRNLFPFCIPWDLMHAVQVLDAEPVAPVFTIPFHVEYRGKVLADEQWVLDFRDYESVVQILWVMEVLGFIVALVMATRALIKG